MDRRVSLKVFFKKEDGEVLISEEDLKEVTGDIKHILKTDKDIDSRVVYATMLLFGKLMITRMSEGYEGAYCIPETLRRNVEHFSEMLTLPDEG